MQPKLSSTCYLSNVADHARTGVQTNHLSFRDYCNNIKDIRGAARSKIRERHGNQKTSIKAWASHTEEKAKRWLDQVLNEFQPDTVQASGYLPTT